MKSTFKILFYPKKNVVDKKGLNPIMGRITISGERAVFSTKLFVDAKNNWSAAKGKAKGNTIEVENLNISLDNISTVINRLKTDLFKKQGFISALELKWKTRRNCPPKNGGRCPVENGRN